MSEIKYTKRDLEALRRPKPAQMVEPRDILEMCFQMQLDGTLDNNSHFALVDKFSALQLYRDDNQIKEAMRAGSKFMLAAIPSRGLVIPIYWKGTQWTTDISKAYVYTEFERLHHWRQKVINKYFSILNVMLPAKVEGA